MLLVTGLILLEDLTVFVVGVSHLGRSYTVGLSLVLSDIFLLKGDRASGSLLFHDSAHSKVTATPGSKVVQSIGESGDFVEILMLVDRRQLLLAEVVSLRLPPGALERVVHPTLPGVVGLVWDGASDVSGQIVHALEF